MTPLPLLALLALAGSEGGAPEREAGEPPPGERAATAPAPSPPAEGTVAEPAAAPTRSRFRLAPAAIETGGIIALEILWYESAIELNKQDFDFARTWPGQRRRWANLYGLRFDSNSFGINMGHAYYNGSYYYDIARVLGGDIWESWLFTLATSSLWEATIEHREVFSINDTIVTPAGGAAIGEAFFQLGRFFERGSPTVANRVLTTIFSPAHTLNDVVGLTSPARTHDVDALGFPRDVWHRFLLDAGMGRSSRGQVGGALRPELRLAIETDLVAVPGHGRPGEISGTLTDGEWSRVRLLCTRDHESISELSVYAEASLWGRYRQSLRGREGDLHGQSLFYGVATAFDMSFARLPDFYDYLGIMHVAGPMADATWHLGALSLRGQLSGYADFAMPRAIAYDELLARGVAVPRTKSVLEQSGYTYAWGFTGAARVEARWKGLGLDGELRYDWFDSIEGRDRFQDSFTSPTGVYHEGVASDFNVRDQRRTLRGAVSWQVPRLPVGLRLWAEDWLRTGQALGVEARYRARRYGLSLTATL